MDEAFMGLHALLEGMLAFDDEFVDEEAGVRTFITAYEIGSPVELDVTRGDDGLVRIGSVPPLYRVDTSLQPSYHALRFRAERVEPGDGALDG